MSSLEALSNNSLLESYHKAIELKLNDEFVHVLKKEIEKRGLSATIK